MCPWGQLFSFFQIEAPLSRALSVGLLVVFVINTNPTWGMGSADQNKTMFVAKALRAHTKQRRQAAVMHTAQRRHGTQEGECGLTTHCSSAVSHRARESSCRGRPWRLGRDGEDRQYSTASPHQSSEIWEL